MAKETSYIKIDEIHKTLIFYWGSGCECTLHNRTHNEALVIAKGFGYTKPKWYKPSTWYNQIVIC